MPPPNLKRNSQFDLKSKGPISCLKLQNVLKQDNLVSLLDGNPVPKTLKWKLKGYKTLRNEQAGDFAFVPGGKSYDFDILTKDELMNSSNCNADRSRTKGRNSDARNDTICLTTKAIENVEEIFCRNKLIGKDDPIIEEAKIEKRETDMSSAVAASNQKISTTSKLLVGTPGNIPPKKEDIKYLPILKTDFSTGQMKYQTQPSVQFSSKPPKNIPKPLPPIMKRQDEGKKLDEAEEKKASAQVGQPSAHTTPPPITLSVTPSTTPSMAPSITPPITPPIPPSTTQPTTPPIATSNQTKPSEVVQRLNPIPEMKKAEKKDSNTTVQFAKVPEPASQEATEATEAIEESVAEPEATMETEVEAKEEAQPEDDITSSKYALEMLKADEMEEELRESRYTESDRRNVSRHLSRGSEEMETVEANEGEVESSRSEQMEMREAESDTNDSELASTNPQVEQLSKGTENIESPSETLNLKFLKPDPAATYFAPRKSSRHGKTGFQAVMEKPVMNITNPYEHERVPSSPCAATQAKLLRSNTDSRNSQGSEMGGGKGSSMSGSSGGGSRKPPASYPPYTSRRSASSNSSNCLTKKLPIAREPESNGLRAMLNTRNPSSNISTSTMNLRNKNKDNQNTKNRKDNKKSNKKECKRYCCPALQTPTDCDYTKFQCPNAKHEFLNATKMVHYDPTCLQSEDEAEIREFCTDPRSHKKCNRER